MFYTPPKFIWACQDGHLEIVERLIKQLTPEELVVPDIDGWTGLHYLCKDGASYSANTLIRKLGTVDKLFTQNHSGWTPFHYVCRGDFPDIMKCLLDTCVITDEHLLRTKAAGWTGLHMACYHQSTDVTRMLIDKFGYDYLTLRDNRGWTPFHYACWSGILPSLKSEIIAFPELIRLQTYSGTTGLCLAVTTWRNGTSLIRKFILDNVDLAVEDLVDVFRNGYNIMQTEQFMEWIWKPID